MKDLPVVEKLLAVLVVIVMTVSFFTKSQKRFINTGGGTTLGMVQPPRSGTSRVRVWMSPKFQGLITDVATMITPISDVNTAKAVTLITTTRCSIKTESPASTFETSLSISFSQRYRRL